MILTSQTPDNGEGCYVTAENRIAVYDCATAQDGCDKAYKTLRYSRIVDLRRYSISACAYRDANNRYCVPKDVHLHIARRLRNLFECCPRWVEFITRTKHPGAGG